LPKFQCVAAGTALARSEFHRTCITTAEALFKKTGAAAKKFANLAAVVVYQMWLYRSILLGLSPDHPSVPVQPNDYVPSDDTLDAITIP
jgi:hypothetical protein